MKAYRTGFLLALVGNVVLVAILAGLWWHSRTRQAAANEPPKQGSTALEASANCPAATAASSDTPLVPVQLSPQRLQSIGVKTGEVERKLDADDIRTTGNVAVDTSKCGAPATSKRSLPTPPINTFVKDSRCSQFTART